METLGPFELARGFRYRAGRIGPAVKCIYREQGKEGKGVWPAKPRACRKETRFHLHWKGGARIAMFEEGFVM